MASDISGNAEHGHEAAVVDIGERQRTFAGFVHFWIYLFTAAALILIFLAIFNS